MNPQPKPVKEARAQKPLRRGRANRGKKTSKRRVAQKKLKKLANDLWSRWIKRNDRCELLGEQIGLILHTACGGALEAMHGLPKKVYPGVRYAAWNGVCGCRDAHAYFTWREPEWQNYLRKRWGNEKYEERLRWAVMIKKNDLQRVLDTYRAALAGTENSE